MDQNQFVFLVNKSIFKTKHSPPSAFEKVQAEDGIKVCFPQLKNTTNHKTQVNINQNKNK